MRHILTIFLGLVCVCSTRPNFLLLFPDEWRFDWDGTHKDPTGPIPLQVPNLRTYMAKGTRFTSTFVAAPLCAPSRSALASGREYDKAGMASNFFNDYPVNQTTFYSLLRDAGYHTMVTGKDDLTKYSGVGLDGMFHQTALGFVDGLRSAGKDDVLRDYPKPCDPYGALMNSTMVHLNNGTPISAWVALDACMKDLKPGCDGESFPDDLYEDNWTRNNTLKLLDRKPQGKPWFLQVNFPGPHPPFLTTASMAASVKNRTWPNPSDGKKDVCDNAPHMPGDGGRCNYAAEIENLDSLFGTILAKIDSLGELDNTLVIISSDHGEMLGDHNDEGKTMPWQGSVGVPLIFFGLDVLQEQVVDTPVATLDIAGTILDYAGVALAENMTTQSLRGFLTGKSAPYREFIWSGLQSQDFNNTNGDGYNWRMVVTQLANSTYKFICCKGVCPGSPSTVPPPEKGWTQLLYDVLEDPFDMKNLADQHPDRCDKMRAMLPVVSWFECGVRP